MQSLHQGPGMILEAVGARDIDLSASFVVGDGWSAVVAGQMADCSTIFVDYGKAIWWLIRLPGPRKLSSPAAPLGIAAWRPADYQNLC
jgi:hypothetical protein